MKVRSPSDYIHGLFQAGTLTNIVLSSPVHMGPEALKRVTARAITLRGGPVWQIERYDGRKTTHQNMSAAQAALEVASLLESSFHQALFSAPVRDTHIALRPDGFWRIANRQTSKLQEPCGNADHDESKNRTIPEGVPSPFMHRLGIMTEDGRVIASQRDKFKQVNRFLEVVADTLIHLPSRNPLSAIDYGCGKGYLTFALYHFLLAARGEAPNVSGLDRNAEVIDACTRTADALDYSGLHFAVGDIGSDSAAEADIVVALHACDTATDAALARAIALGSSVILASPCCQHELNSQLDNDRLRAMLKHGIIRDRLTALVTDSLRASLLEAMGYSVRLIEFIDSAHTPKNLLIRAVRDDSASSSKRRESMKEYRAAKSLWGVTPLLESLLESRLDGLLDGHLDRK